MDLYVAIEEALGACGCKEILASNVLSANPQLRGAQVANMIAMYNDHDGCLWFAEPVLERCGKGWCDAGIPIGYYGAAAVAVALLNWPHKTPPPSSLHAEHVTDSPTTWLTVELLARRAMAIAGVDEVIRGDVIRGGCDA